MELTYTSVAQIKKNYNSVWFLAGLLLVGIILIKYIDNQRTYGEDKRE